MTSTDPSQWKYPDWHFDCDGEFTIDGLREIASMIVVTTNLRVQLDLFDVGYAKVDVFREALKIGEIYVNRHNGPTDRIYSVYFGEDDKEAHTHEIESVIELLVACRTAFPESE